MASLAVFSTVRADISSEFVDRFPQCFGFDGMLHGICKDSGVNLVHGIHYVLQGQWEPMGKVRDHLVDALKHVKIYAATDGENKETPSDEKFNGKLDNISFPVHTCFENAFNSECRSEKSNELKHQSNDIWRNSLQTSSKVTIDFTKENDFPLVKVEQTVDNSISEHDEYFDDREEDSDESNEELKTKISSICSSLKVYEEDREKADNNTALNLTKTYAPDNRLISEGNDEDVGEMKNWRLKKRKGRPRKHLAKVQNHSIEKISKKTFNMVGPNMVNSLSKSISEIQREKICNKYKTGLKLKNTKLSQPNLYLDDIRVKHNCGRPRKDAEKKSDFPCKDCDFVAKSKNQLGDHRRRVHLARPTKCDVCNKIFPNARYMKRHRSSHVQPQHCCDICGKMYKILKALREHRKTHDVGYTKPEFICEICSKSFCTRYILECHKKSEHCGERKSFLCSTCGKSFTTKHTLIQHSNVHTGSRPYECDICRKSFSYESALRDHKFIHSQDRIFNCKLCKKSFRQRSALKMHEKIHQEKKDFTCRECGRGFTQKQALQRHERAHKGDKPFCCKLCGRTFGDASIIRRHMKLVHKIHKDSKTWREDIVARGKMVQSQPVSLEHICENKTSIDDEDESNDSIPNMDNPKTYQRVFNEQIENVPSHISLPTTVTSTAKSPVPATHSRTLPDTSQPVQAHTSRVSSTGSRAYGTELSSPMDYHVATDSVDVSNRYDYVSPRQHFGQTSTSSTENSTAESKFPATQVIQHTRLPRVDSVLSKRVVEVEAPENLSISSLYTYYTNLASQCISVSQYQSYVSSSDGHSSNNQH